MRDLTLQFSNEMLSNEDYEYKVYVIRSTSNEILLQFLNDNNHQFDHTVLCIIYDTLINRLHAIQDQDEVRNRIQEMHLISSNGHQEIFVETLLQEIHAHYFGRQTTQARYTMQQELLSFDFRIFSAIQLFKILKENINPLKKDDAVLNKIIEAFKDALKTVQDDAIKETLITSCTNELLEIIQEAFPDFIPKQISDKGRYTYGNLIINFTNMNPLTLVGSIKCIHNIWLAHTNRSQTINAVPPHIAEGIAPNILRFELDPKNADKPSYNFAAMIKVNFESEVSPDVMRLAQYKHLDPQITQGIISTALEHNNTRFNMETLARAIDREITANQRTRH